MSLEEFMKAHREQILQACQQELGVGSSTARLGTRFAELLVDLARANGEQVPSSEFTLVGSHPTISRVRANLEQLSRRSRTPVLLLGDFGTGKRRCVRALHEATYPEGELFELRGTQDVLDLERRVTRLRTRSSAHATAGMTLYVHNVTEASTQVQKVVTMMLRELGLQLRVVASSTRSLTQACREGAIRSELVFGFPTTIELTRLKDRAADIPLLVQHFAAVVAAPGKAGVVFSDGALDRLMQHNWPGNLAELKILVQRMNEQCPGSTVEVNQLPDLGASAESRFKLPATGLDLAELERDLLVQALEMAANNQTAAARLLGLSRDQIRYRLAKLDVPDKQARG